MRWAELLTENKEAIARLETREMGKPIRQTRAIVDGLARRIHALCQARRELQGEHFNTQTSRAGESVLALSLREPHGLVAGILPFNSPVSALVWKAAPALLMGNAVIVKVSEHAPLAALFAARLLSELDLPTGALQVVNGDGHKLGPVLSEHGAVRAISFTGGSTAGEDVFRRSAAAMKHLVLECGSNDAALVLDDADLQAAAKGIIQVAMRTYGGQICVAPKRCIVAAPIYDSFLETLRTEAATVICGNPLDDQTELGPLVNESAAARVEQEVQQSIAAGARVVLGGARVSDEYSSLAFFPPTIVADVEETNPLFREGAFGPVVGVTCARGDEQAIALANDSPYALRASVWGRDVRRATNLARLLDCGGVAVNGAPTVDNARIGVEPRKQSGVGEEGIYSSLLEMSQSKFIWINGWWTG